MSFSSDVLTLERGGAVATLWLDDPERRNAMGPAFWADLPVAMAEIGDDADVRAVVLAAKGPHFTAGLDLASMGGIAAHREGESPSVHRTRVYREITRLQASITSVADCPKPVVAAVQGACIGGGIDLITACDVRLASRDAVFSVRETKVAIVADVGTLQRLPRVLTAGHVAELVFTGKDIDAARAREIGLVNDVHGGHEAVVEAAQAMAAEIAANSPIAVQGAKAVLRATEQMSVADGLDYVAVWNSAFLLSRDLGEAATAFFETRPPRFTGE